MGLTPAEEPVTAGTTLILSDIRSQNYVAGTSGWIVEADGDAEFNNLTVRGELFVTGDDGSQVSVEKYNNSGSIQPRIFLEPGDPAGFGGYDPATIYAQEAFPSDPDRILELDIVSPGWNFPAAKTAQIRLKSNNVTATIEQVIELLGRTVVKDVSGSNGSLYIQSALQVGNQSNNQNYRFAVSATDGTLSWSAGTIAADTNLYRSAADTLKTDDSLIIGATLSNATDGMAYRRGQVFTPLISNAAAASFTQAVNFPVAFPAGVVPTISLNVADASGATLKAIVSAFSITNTGFTLRARSGDGTAMGAWTNIPVQVTALV